MDRIQRQILTNQVVIMKALSGFFNDYYYPYTAKECKDLYEEIYQSEALLQDPKYNEEESS